MTIRTGPERPSHASLSKAPAGHSFPEGTGGVGWSPQRSRFLLIAELNYDQSVDEIFLPVALAVGWLLIGFVYGRRGKGQILDTLDNLFARLFGHIDLRYPPSREN
jgi:hypothetical protein